mmetsp:Transcript_41157/g.78877  ORF Transcript_41157/g.78877 Transcript_41157/m.78877 type:complete len:282 (+) Transcript_41157:98-943(+)
MPCMKRPAGAAGLEALQMIKKAIAEKQPGNLAVNTHAEAERAVHPRLPVSRKAADAKQAAESVQRGSAKMAEASRQREVKKADAELAKGLEEEKQRADAAIQRVIAAQARAAAAEREAAILRDRVQEFVAASKETSAARILAEKKISHAEGQSEVLREQACMAAQSLERAARAEERSEVLCDLQTKLPFLIRAVTSSLANEGWPAAQNAFPNMIKLEYDEDICADKSAVRIPALPPSRSQSASGGTRKVESASIAHESSIKTSMMKRALTAITGGRRQLKA